MPCFFAEAGLRPSRRTALGSRSTAAVLCTGAVKLLVPAWPHEA
jgi:hypothetical protein